MAYMNMSGNTGIVDRIVDWLVSVLRLRVKEEKRRVIVQFIKFGIVGLSNTIISYAIFVFFLFLFQNKGIFPKFDYLISQIIAFVLSVLWSFYWNNKYVFYGRNRCFFSVLLALLKTYMSYAFSGLFLSSVLSFLWVESLGFPKLVAPIINLIFSVPLNFVLNKFWAFREKA